MEDTQKQQKDPEREALIAEMLRDATKTELPSDLTKNPILNPDDKEAPPTVVNKITSAGYVFVWDTRTYQKAPVLYYMLPQILRQRRPDGSYRWSVNDPHKETRRGTFKCLLHKDNPNREHYTSLGFRVCPKDNLANQYQVTRHMQLKHKAEWAAIEQEKRDKERAEDRELQHLLLASQINNLEKREETKKVEEPKPETLVISTEVFICPTCQKEFKYKKTFKKHIKTCK